MNFQLEPEDYEDPNTTIETILEAIRLLQADGNEPLPRSAFNAWLGFPPSRLKNASYGPEIVWLMNILADRALELHKAEQRQRASTGTLISANNNNSNNTNQNQRKSSLRVVYRSDQQQTPNSNGSNNKLDCITIGQPLVGGGLTTRPLGTYRIDDDALVLKQADLEAFWEDNNHSDNSIHNNKKTSQAAKRTMINSNNDENDNYDRGFSPLSGDEASDWYDQVNQVSTHLETIDLSDDFKSVNQANAMSINWQEYLVNFEQAREIIGTFFKESREPMENISARIKRELQVIWAREKFIQTQANKEIDDYLKTYQKYSKLLNENKELERNVEKKMASFEWMNEKLRNIRELVEKRTRDLADGKHLRELESKINQLRSEKSQFDVKIGLLMGIYANKQTELLADATKNNHLNSQ